MGKSPEMLWKECLRIFAKDLKEQEYRTWFEPIRIASYEKPVLTFELPSQYFYEVVSERYGQKIFSVVRKIFGEDTLLKYCLMVDQTNQLTVNIEPDNKPVAALQKSGRDNAATSAGRNTPAVAELNSQLNPNYTFDNFIEGNSNRLSLTIGHSIAEQPKRDAFNPMFIYGPSGVGKTHLVNAIGLKIKELHPHKRVLYMSAHLFQVQYTDSVRKNTVNDFINFYQTIDVLIIDDVQEFASLNKTQNTFFHIFNHLHQLGRQLIFTSDRPPAALQGMEERLITRFRWGITAELEKPDQKLRHDILDCKIRREGLNIPAEVVDFVSENVCDSIRDLEGIIISLMAYSVVWDRNIDLPLAEKIVSRTVKMEKKPITIELILEKTCEYFNIKQEDIFTASRKQSIVQVRQIAMYLAQKYTKISSARIGVLIGNRNHATVLHSCKVVEDRIQVDKTFKNKLEEIELLLKNR